MSEEDILEIIEELQCEYKEQENENKYNNYTVFKAKKYSKAIQGLLELYNKEKQKNEELEEQLCDIHSNFCKFNWKESNGVQVYNQLKELYNSIYRTKNK